MRNPSDWSPEFLLIAHQSSSERFGKNDICSSK